jgi:hypothetical protein
MFTAFQPFFNNSIGLLLTTISHTEVLLEKLAMRLGGANGGGPGGEPRGLILLLEAVKAALKLALFTAHFTEGSDLGDPETLVAVAAGVGLDAAAARDILASGAYTNEVRHDERYWREQGISAVPAVIIDGKYLISGGQPVEAFEKALRRIASEIPA